MVQKLELHLSETTFYWGILKGVCGAVRIVNSITSDSVTADCVLWLVLAKVVCGQNVPFTLLCMMSVSPFRITTILQLYHNDVIKVKHFPRYWSFVRGIHRGPTQRPVSRIFDVNFDLRPNTRLSKLSWGCWFETPSRPLWRHRNVFVWCTSQQKQMPSQTNAQT